MMAVLLFPEIATDQPCAAYAAPRADELAALLCPHAANACEGPRGPNGETVAGGYKNLVVRPAGDRSVPSAEIATEVPCWAYPTAPVPTSLLPCCDHTPPLRVNTHAAPVLE